MVVYFQSGLLFTAVKIFIEPMNYRNSYAGGGI